MYDIRQFRRTLYAVLLLGVVGYGIALDSLAHLVIGVTLVVLHIYVTRGQRRVAIPRFLAGAIALISGAWSAAGLIMTHMTPLMAISQWLFTLLLVTMWSRQDNRAYGQMLVMSLVLIVAGAINTASLIYGLLLVGYLFLSLYCCLLFHLKIEAEQATRTSSAMRNGPGFGVTGADYRLFRRSLRRLTTIIATVSITLGLIVFLFFPRAQSPGLLMQMQMSQPAPLTGFSERLGFEQVARISQNPQVVAHVVVTRNGEPVRLPVLYLRGVTLDVYSGESSSAEGLNWQWLRSQRLTSTSDIVSSSLAATRLPEVSAPGDLEQSILLQPTGSTALFVLDGVSSLRLNQPSDLVYNAADGTIRLSSLQQSSVQYTAVSTGEPPAYVAPSDTGARPFATPRIWRSAELATVPEESVIAPRIAEYARRADVCGADGKGRTLAKLRGPTRIPHPLDATIAENIVQHFQKTFRYTLDLSDAKRHPHTDPLEAFLYQDRRGHCEYFAGAMALLCQSLGMDARVVIGFRAGMEDYNRLGGYFVIRQSHAHAWVEVLTLQGWKRFDPTVGGDGYTSALPGHGILRRLSDLVDYLQYKWATSVVTYSNQNRADILQHLDSFFTESTSRSRETAQRVKDYLLSERGYILSSRVLSAGIAGSILVLLAAITIFLAEKRRMYRRAERIGLGNLPAQRRLRLARQLAFYDDLLLALSRQRIHRDAHQTPLEFAQSLTYLPADAYQQVNGLTRIFYRIRFGEQRLSAPQRRNLHQIVVRLSHSLGRATGNVIIR